uniref:t-SNARE coiled-coil homology domain-containing protein n=1 Tax=Cannabis sativa TaxID=3483 RepID=A0A803Q751_CANSA
MSVLSGAPMNTFARNITGDIHDEVETHNRFLDRMGNNMDASRGIMSGTMDRFKRAERYFPCYSYDEHKNFEAMFISFSWNALLWELWLSTKAELQIQRPRTIDEAMDIAQDIEEKLQTTHVNRPRLPDYCRVGHRCKKKEFNVVLMFNESEAEPLDSKGDKSNNEAPEFESNETNTNMEVSLQSMVGLTSNNTMILKGVIQGVDVWNDFLPIKLGSADLILGLQWPTTLDMTHIDWKMQTMEFQVGNQCVTIKGDPSLGRNLVTLKTMYKTLLAEKNGILLELNVVTTTPTEIENECPNYLGNLLFKHEAIFSPPEELPPSRQHEHAINLQLGTTPISVRPYCHPYFQKAEIEKLIKEMLPYGIIQPNNNPFSGPVLLVKKKMDHGGFASIIELSTATIPDKYPILAEAETTFRIHDGYYEFLVIPFGMTNAPTTFQSFMNDIFQPQLRSTVLVFFDDILICSKIEEEHIAHLDVVFEILGCHKLYVNKKKCVFGKREGCETCQRNKYLIASPAVLLQPILLSAQRSNLPQQLLAVVVQITRHSAEAEYNQSPANRWPIRLNWSLETYFGASLMTIHGNGLGGFHGPSFGTILLITLPSNALRSKLCMGGIPHPCCHMKRKVGKVAYKLQLPNHTSIRPVFHVSQLRHAIGGGHMLATIPPQLARLGASASTRNSPPPAAQTYRSHNNRGSYQADFPPEI